MVFAMRNNISIEEISCQDNKLCKDPHELDSVDSPKDLSLL